MILRRPPCSLGKVAPRFLLGAVVAFASSTPARPQSVLHLFEGESNAGQFGWSVCSAGDVDNDGYDDVIVGAPEDSTVAISAGSARVFSGRTGLQLHLFQGELAYDSLGASVSGIGDVNQDGHDDVIIGAPGAGPAGSSFGQAKIRSGKTGAVLRTFQGTTIREGLGFCVSGILDVTGDQIPDVLIGVPNRGTQGASSGAVEVRSGATGALVREFLGDQAGDRFGWSVASAGDVDANGTQEIIVGAPSHGLTSSRPGYARVLSIQTGATLRNFLGLQGGDLLGWSVDGVGDLDQDFQDEVIVGAPGDSQAGSASGSAWVFDVQTGAIHHSFSGVQAGDELGFDVAGLEDMDGDGIPEFAVGAQYEAVGAARRGAVHVYAGGNGIELHHLRGKHNLDRFGSSIANAGDSNGDGFGDLIIGSRQEDPGGPNAGTARVYSGNECRSPRSYCKGKANSLGCVPSTFSLGSATASGLDDFRVLAEDVLNQRIGGLFWGRDKRSLPFAGGTLCVQNPLTRSSPLQSGGKLGTVDCSGRLSFEFTHAYCTQMGIQVGDHVYCQFWSRDPGAAVSPISLSNGLAFTLCP